MQMRIRKESFETDTVMPDVQKLMTNDVIKSYEERISAMHVHSNLVFLILEFLEGESPTGRNHHNSGDFALVFCLGDTIQERSPID